MTTWVDTYEPTVVPRPRLSSVDRVRGLAVVLMVCDHLARLVSWGEPVRVTLGRAAMPLFFLVAGSLARRLTWRHAWVLLLGLLLPVAAPWVDAPNVLVWYVLGCVLLAGLRAVGVSAWWVVLVALTVSANGWSSLVWSGYSPLPVWGLLAAGSLLGVGAWGWGDRLPVWLDVVGRYPLTVYVGHVLLLTAVVGWLA